MSILLLPLLSLAAAPQAPQSGFTISGTRVELTQDADGPHYSLRLADGTTSRLRPQPATIPLRAGAFDPALAEPAWADAPVAAGSGLQLVQYKTQPLSAYADALLARGLRTVRFIGGGTVVVEGSATALDSLSQLPFVRWSGPFHAVNKLDPTLVESLQQGTLENARYRIQVLDRGPEMKGAVARRIEQLGAAIDNEIPSGFLLDATLTPSQLAEIVTWPQVFYVDLWTAPVAYMDKVRVNGGANQLESVEGLTGQGVRGEVLDFGLAVNHPDLQSPPPVIHNGAGPATFHGTECTGIVFGDGTGSADARGLLPDAQPIFGTYTNLNDRYQHTLELLSPTGEAVFQSNSWGPGPSLPGYYNSTFEIDDILFQHDLLTFQAMANEGANRCDQLAWGKNIVSVGGIQHLDTQGLGDDVWQNAGSIGPCEDGRIKPEVAFWYDSIRTISGNAGYTNTFGGTSAATPESAGHGGLIMQMWFEGLLGNVHDEATVFAAKPKHSTARALLVNGAVPYDFNGANVDLNRLHQGWGRPNVATLLEDGDNLFAVDETRVLSNLQTAAYTLEVEAGTPALIATLVYLDPAGTTSSTQNRINDLSLRVTAPDGTQYWGNNGLLADNASDAGGSSNTLDTVENVRLPQPAAGTWTVEVLADELVADAHAETPALDADFGLVVRGIKSAWEDLGGGSASVGTPPTLTGTGHLAGGDFFRLDLAGATASSTTYFVIGGMNGSLPISGGVLVPTANLVFPASVDASGNASLLAEVPTGFSGEDYFFQALTVDLAQPPFFVTFSNALRAVIR